ncbi:M15 family metallopeptidase [Streptococcus pacificus]|uniref:D-alanyl-D-alanine carboxypeptidase family protein n=1 Tax=Streptococcus pacificus TaxID=2740577 RepID=A0ABS0ZJT5_9STRE|nr:M15 family metallopeptidase [Streptococcus pacificus]MBJ8326143.1 D-alanyl-D-alanine carboxypeptidase family protein [Streptococcus pacificus]
MEKRRHRRAQKKSPLGLIIAIVVVIIAFVGLSIAFFWYQTQPVDKTAPKDKVTQQETTETKTDSQEKSTENLPNVSADDWELILVNRDNITPELNPQLEEVAGILVDARIAENVRGFLTAAQAIDPNEHLISGYRSVAYQEQVFNGYVEQEMAERGISREEAETFAKEYSQPPGASEHQTGLAIDMSTVDLLNQSDPAVVEQVVALAPEYGFVLRFNEEKKPFTGIGYEDWHFRYVGVESAKYMVENNLSLEEYVERLRGNN